MDSNFYNIIDLCFFDRKKILYIPDVNVIFYSPSHAPLGGPQIQIKNHVEMATGKNPLGITCPNSYPRRKNTPAKKPIPVTGIKFCPNPYPCRFRVPNEFPIPTNINIKIIHHVNNNQYINKLG
jgi:hypothetical protein